MSQYLKGAFNQLHISHGKQLQHIFYGSEGENNPDGVTVMSSGLSQLRLQKSLYYNMENYTLKDVAYAQQEFNKKTHRQMCGSVILIRRDAPLRLVKKN